MKEIIICSAVKINDLIIRGHRHCDCYHNLSRRLNYKDVLLNGKQKDGFITSKNRFVDRIEAKKIQEKAGIKSKCGYMGNILYSEDLY